MEYKIHIFKKTPKAFLHNKISQKDNYLHLANNNFGSTFPIAKCIILFMSLTIIFYTTLNNSNASLFFPVF